jgi:branched-chain amino acid transport system substrate-binding protein
MRTRTVARFAAIAAVAAAFGAQAADQLKIGFLSTLSGPAAAIGIEIRDGFNLAVKLAGNQLGGLPTEVVFADDQLNPEVGKQQAERLLRRDRVNLMTGIVFSNVMIAVWPTLQQAKMFYVAPNSTPTSISGKGCSPYFFSASWPNEGHHEAAGHFATSKGYKNAYLIAPNYPAGKDALTGFKRSYKGKIVAEVYTKLNQLDYAAELAQLRAANPDTLYAFLPGGMGINFIKQFVAAGLSKDIQLVVPGFVSDQDVVRAVGEPMLGLFDTSHWAYDLDNEANRKFVWTAWSVTACGSFRAPAAPKVFPPSAIICTPTPWLTSMSTRPARIARARLAGASIRTRDHTVMTTVMSPTRETSEPMALKTAASKAVSSLKCDSTPRHFCMEMRKTSSTDATDSAPRRSQPARFPILSQPTIHATVTSVSPKDRPKTTGLRQEIGPAHGPRSTR